MKRSRRHESSSSEESDVFANGNRVKALEAELKFLRSDLDKLKRKFNKYCDLEKEVHELKRSKFL
jgi:predicted RNase H-like nuclease (RuvC/YqgF family)